MKTDENALDLATNTLKNNVRKPIKSNDSIMKLFTILLLCSATVRVKLMNDRILYFKKKQIFRRF